jgi:hypothetical protein
MPAQFGQDGQQIRSQGGKVVAAVGLVRLPMTALVDGGHRVPGGRQSFGYSVPEAGVRSQPVHQQNGGAGVVQAEAEDLEGDLVGHLDAQGPQLVFNHVNRLGPGRRRWA